MGVTFELAAPFDLAGIKLPRRVVVGGSLPLEISRCFFNTSRSRKGGCRSWRLDNKINIGGTDYLLDVFMKVMK